MCFNHCPVECTETTFFDMNINEYTHSDNTSSRVIIEWAAQPVTNIIHQPKWDLWDLLGTLGGQVHIWLGISIIHLILFTIKIVRSSELIFESSFGGAFHWFRYIFARH